MPRRSVRQRRRSQGCLTTLISIMMVLALVLVAAIFVTEKYDITIPDGKKVPKATATAAPVSDEKETDNSSMVLNANTFSDEKIQLAAENTPVVHVPTATPVPQATATPEPTYDPNDPYALVRPQPEREGLLPVFKSANTEKKQIAITLNECSGAAITRNFCQLAMKYDAKLTLFPLGENILVTNMDVVLRKCVFELGYEVENAGYTYTSRLYRMTDEEMAMEIWKHNMALNYVLGGDYQPHFLRVFGGNGDNDPRTHAYLKQEGYLGFAGWNISGSDRTTEDLLQTLRPGNVYYFKTSESDYEKLEALMKTAKRAGYEMVTMNELFGYEENVYTEIEGSVLSEQLPLLEGYDGAYYTLRNGDSTWAVYNLQKRLSELGYLPKDSADGVYGTSTTDAVCQFQANNGIAASGMASVETQELLFSDKAK